MGVAARVAGWQRRLGGQAGPLGAVSAGSGDSPNGAVLQVELFVGGVWTDITSYVMTRDGSGHVSISRGQPDEGISTDPGRCSFQLNNRDGRFSPRNPLSPYYGQLGRNQPIRVSVPSGNDKSYRFWGEVSSWPQRWDITGTDVWVDLEAAGILRRLGQGASPLRSAMRASYAAPGTVPAFTGVNIDRILAYWPLEAESGATQAASDFPGGSPMTKLGTPTFGALDTFVCSDAITFMGTASLTGVVGAYTATTSTNVRFLFAFPSGGATDGQVLIRLLTTGSAARLDLVYNSAGGGTLTLKAYTVANVLISSAGPSSTSVNGQLLQGIITADTFGSDVDISFDYDDITGSIFDGALVTLTSQSFGVIQKVVLAPDRGLSDTAIGHVLVQQGNAGNVVLQETDGVFRAFQGDYADDRAFRLVKQANLTFQQIGTAEDTERMGYQRISTLLDLLSECVAADLGILYELLDSIGLGYRTRASLYNQTAALTLSYSSFNLSEVPIPVDDDQHTENDVTVQRVGGSSGRIVQTVGRLSVDDPPSGAGRYDNEYQVNLYLDGQAVNSAGWRVWLGTTDESRYPKISVNLAHSTFTSNPALRNQVLSVRQGDRIVITGMPTWLPPDDVSLIVVGASETIDNFQHRVTFNCVPESPYRVAVLDSTTQGRLDTAGSFLVDGASSSDTSFRVGTSSGPVWTTTDVPFDVMVVGERITVTAVSGAVSPQTFTVTRSVNGIVKALPQNADVRLFQPMILAL